MYLRIANNNKTNRTYLSIVESFYDKNTKKSRSRTIQSLGFLDILEKEFPDPVAHFSKIVEDMKLQVAQENSNIQVNFNPQIKLSIGTNNRKNFGYAAFSYIYHTLEIDKFLINRQRSTKIESNTNNIMKLLVFSRLLDPGSKRKAHDNRDQIRQMILDIKVFLKNIDQILSFKWDFL